jgi:hypothetical protein
MFSGLITIVSLPHGPWVSVTLLAQLSYAWFLDLVLMPHVGTTLFEGGWVVVVCGELYVTAHDLVGECRVYGCNEEHINVF